MKHSLRLAACLLLALASACACSRSRPGEDALVVGTVVDASTGARVPGVRIEGPHGTSAVSGEDGRFEIDDLREGDSGEVVARAQDGRSGKVTLRPLAAGRLEVVVHLAQAR